ncbi:MAG TPA: isocitrate lyase/phosphoenolpyruvate mutase family protein [Acidimicrobiales bacterium]|nr:isocitrate lyase/phosphoenolpyruvate mutase family protein [Acidimicrobiales bacterium]HXZ63018.1 isocitrate lyase/phosphoenolpyruvate mutase family protein [Acidimicrobiales bacterium]
MAELRGKAGDFLALHHDDRPLLQPNAWDEGSAKLLEALGFRCIATTSSGFAASRGQLDGSVTREEVLDHGARLAAAVNIPVAADMENGFADDPEGVARTVTLACATAVAGCSIEDFTRRRDDPIYERRLAAERVAAAAEAAHSGPVQLVLTARAENHIHGRGDLADTIARCQAYQEANADVLFAPGLTSAQEIQSLVSSVDAPVSVLVQHGSPPVDELAALGVARVSVGGAFAYSAYAGMVDAAREFMEAGTYSYWQRFASNRELFREAFRSDRES